ncbi:cyclin-dependent kinase G-2-like isoform X2 [Carex littledalei]|uniref:Cyclin-dependent kinase G-2-like isoform X2 n=1 Tax=Carex littledalei TaxID=544730 RepID=A0A833RPJ1_9POAL|nr:cyclin-dependent kinase G-2-like isoform X2 [Carex littledalei]
MAPGRTDREFNLEISRRNRYRDSNPSRRDFSRDVKFRDSNRREVSNGYHHSNNDYRNYPRRNRSPAIEKTRALDREPGELSSGSGSDEPELNRDATIKQNGEPVKSEDEGSLGKKRKFSPIVWDRDGTKQPDQSNKPGKEVSVNETLDPLPPPTEPMDQDVHILDDFIDSRKDDSDNEPGQIEEDEDLYPAPRTISSSRWAEIDDDRVVVAPKMKSASPLERVLAKKVPTPEPGEVVTRNGSERAVSTSSGSERGEREVDFMDVDGERLSSDSDYSYGRGTESESSREESPEPPKPRKRSINMLQGCRSVDEFERLNKINEGTYGVVYRARDKKSGEVVALKKVKMEKEKEGFPMTALREINILLSFHHPSIVDVKEVVVGSTMDSIFMVMEYMEHDLKGVMETMKQPYSQSEVKCLMLQLLEGTMYLHHNWVLHRDLKTSNLLLNNRGELKICDFGLARQYGSPLKPYTPLVVTLWYRAPELLLGAKEYSTAIDMWSVGCIMAELLAKEPLFNGQNEKEQIDKIFKTLGTPNENIWPGYKNLPGSKVVFTKQPYNRLRDKFPATSFSGRPTLSEAGFDLLNKLLTYDPERRISAEEALRHPWFSEVPLPKSRDFMPTFPAHNDKDRNVRRRVMKSPDPLEQLKAHSRGDYMGNRGVFG